MATEIQKLMGLGQDMNEPNGYFRAYMLRRLAQMALCADRKISMAELSRRVGITREGVRQYFQGSLLTGNQPSPKYPTLELAVAAREDLEDRIETAIEDISRETDWTPGPVVDYIPTLLTQELMRA